MRVVFSPEARQEFEETEHYYNLQVPQLGSQFRKEVVTPCRAYRLGRCPVK